MLLISSVNTTLLIFSRGTLYTAYLIRGTPRCTSFPGEHSTLLISFKAALHAAHLIRGNTTLLISSGEHSMLLI